MSFGISSSTFTQPSANLNSASMLSSPTLTQFAHLYSASTQPMASSFGSGTNSTVQMFGPDSFGAGNASSGQSSDLGSAAQNAANALYLGGQANDLGAVAQAAANAGQPGGGRDQGGQGGSSSQGDAGSQLANVLQAIAPVAQTAMQAMGPLMGGLGGAGGI
jgi:hypothetical protein